ncbi:DNA damage-binding protein 1a [Mycoemilia scoparia]|uniref:DNA damage-binding protein 1a n=1 Tax=Mycoemilia scoparia TaxID=417184 RepID=A0A9W7ZU42_9FUNG|nr:DNA damage-binding protein 1a [Mycoemilia scoparia]
MQYHYVVTAHKPTSVQAAVKGTFINPGVLNLIVAKNNVLEIYHTSTESGARVGSSSGDVGGTGSSGGFKLIAEYTLNGVIQTLDFIHPQGRITGLIFITTSKRQFMTLVWDSLTGKPRTESAGDVIERVGRPVEGGTITSVDPDSRAIAILTYQGLLKILPMVSNEADQKRAPKLVKQLYKKNRPGLGFFSQGVSGGGGGGGSSASASVGILGFDTILANNNSGRDNSLQNDWPYTVRYLANQQPGGGGTFVNSPTSPVFDHPFGIPTTNDIKGKGKAVACEVLIGDIYPGQLFRIEELKVIDIKFLYGCEKPTLAILYEDSSMVRNIQVYQAHLVTDQELKGIWDYSNVDPTASQLAPLPNGCGVIVLAQDSITFVPFNSDNRCGNAKGTRGGDSAHKASEIETADSQSSRIVVSTKSSVITAYEFIDDNGERLLIGDEDGVLSLVVLIYEQKPKKVVKDIRIQRLGDISTPTSLALLPNDRLFIGSHYGDSQLIRLNTEPVPLSKYQELEKLDPWSFGKINIHGKPISSNPNSATFVEPLDTFSNLGPIVDFCIITNEGYLSQGQVITCSGTGTKPSLRIVRNGIGIENETSTVTNGILGIWSLASALSPSDSSYVVLTFVNDTRLMERLECDNSGGYRIEEVDIRNTGWESNETTLLVSNVGTNGSLIVQITSKSVKLIEVDSWIQISAWTSDSLAVQHNRSTTTAPKIISACCNGGSQIALALENGFIVCLEVRGLNLTNVGYTQVPNDEISSIDIHSFTSDKHDARSMYILAGTWYSRKVLLFSLPSFTIVNEIELDDDSALCRSLLMCKMGGVSYMMVGLGDGQLINYICELPLTQNTDMEKIYIKDKRKITLGTRPLKLLPFLNEGALHILVASDRPTVIFNHHRKLMYSNLNVPDITHACAFSSSDLPSRLCFVNGINQLTIGKIDPIRKLHIRCVPLPSGDSPHRIAHQTSTQTLGVLIISVNDDYQLAGADHDSYGILRLSSNSTPGINTLPPPELGKLMIMDDQTFDVMATLELKPFELPESIASVTMKLLDPTSSNNSNATQTSTRTQIGHHSMLGSSSPANHNADDLYSEMQVDELKDRDCSGSHYEDFYVIGTSIVREEEDDATEGRILLVKYNPRNRRLTIVDEYKTDGAVYQVINFKGMVAATSKNKLLLLGWQKGVKKNRSGTSSSSANDQQNLHSTTAQSGGSNPDSNKNSSSNSNNGDGNIIQSSCHIKILAKSPTHVASIGLSSQGEFLAVGDLMSSVALFKYEYNAEKQEHKLSEISRDYGNNWTTATAAIPLGDQYQNSQTAAGSLSLSPGKRSEIASNPSTFAGTSAGKRRSSVTSKPLFESTSENDEKFDLFGKKTDERFLIGENGMNIYKVRRDSTSVKEEDRKTLKVEGSWHLGDLINQIRPGSLVMDIPDPDLPIKPTLIFVTLTGAVGVVANIESNKCGRILERLQANMANLLTPVGLLPHKKWRSFTNLNRTSDPFGFIDGDLVETFLDLSPEKQNLVYYGGKQPIHQSPSPKANNNSNTAASGTSSSKAMDIILDEGQAIAATASGGSSSHDGVSPGSRRGKDKEPASSTDLGTSRQKKRKEHHDHTLLSPITGAGGNEDSSNDPGSRSPNALPQQQTPSLTTNTNSIINNFQNRFYLPDEEPFVRAAISTVSNIEAEENISLSQLVKLVESLSRLH